MVGGGVIVGVVNGGGGLGIPAPANARGISTPPAVGVGVAPSNSAGTFSAGCFGISGFTATVGSVGGGVSGGVGLGGGGLDEGVPKA